MPQEGLISCAMPVFEGRVCVPGVKRRGVGVGGREGMAWRIAALSWRRGRGALGKPAALRVLSNNCATSAL